MLYEAGQVMVFCISTELHASRRTRNSSCMMNNPPETRAFLPRASLGHAVDEFLQLELHMQSHVTLERKYEMYLGMITIIISMKNPRSNSKSKKENYFWSLWNTTTSLMEDLDADAAANMHVPEFSLAAVLLWEP
jgi:hypothetical protein